MITKKVYQDNARAVEEIREKYHEEVIRAGALERRVKSLEEQLDQGLNTKDLIENLRKQVRDSHKVEELRKKVQDAHEELESCEKLLEANLEEIKFLEDKIQFYMALYFDMKLKLVKIIESD